MLPTLLLIDRIDAGLEETDVRLAIGRGSVRISDSSRIALPSRA